MCAYFILTFIVTHSIFFLIKFDTVVKLAMNSMSTSLMTSKQAKEMLEKIDDDSAKAEFIANMIVRIVAVNNYCAFCTNFSESLARKKLWTKMISFQK
jgi:hypothetical protein